MTDLVVKNLEPSEKTKILLEGTMFGYSARSAAIEVFAPPACPRMNVVKTTYKVDPGTVRKFSGNEFGFYRYSKGPTVNKLYKLRFFFLSKTPKRNLNVGDQIRILAADSSISFLNGRVLQIIANGILTTGNSFVEVQLSTDLGVPAPSQKSVNSSTNSVKEYEGRVRVNKFTVSIPNQEVFQKLVNAKEKPSGVSDWVVRDIPIYAYRNYDGKIKAQDKLLLMFNDEEIKDSEPPTYTLQKEEALLVPSYSVTWEVKEKPNYNFYVAIARYTKRNNEWKGEWLQINSAKKPIWSRAVKSGN